MNKMKALSSLALTLMLTGVLAACGDNEANSPAPASQSDETLPAEQTKTKEDNSNHPTNETDIDIEEDAPAAGTTDSGDTPESKDSQALPDAKDSSITIDKGATTNEDKTPTPVPSDDEKDSPAADKSTDGAAATPSTDTKTQPAETAPADSAAAAQSAQGEYVGLADGHTAEIEVNGEAVAYQLSDEAQAQIGKIPADAKVTFTYTEKAFDADTKVLTITDIQAAQ